MFKLLTIALLMFGMCGAATVSAYDDSPDPRMSAPGSKPYVKQKPSSRDKWMKAQREERKPGTKTERTRASSK